MRSAAAPYGEVPARAIERSQAGERGKDMKLHEALRKVIRHFGVNVIEEKRLMSFLADYRAFDDYPAVKEVMRAIATGDSGKKICLAADGSDEEFLRIASEIKEKLVSERSFKEEFARYAVDSVSFALGIVSSVSEPSDHGYEAVQRNTGSQGSSGAQESRTHASPATPQAATPTQSSGTAFAAFTVSGDTWQAASDGAESHRRFYRGHDLTAAFDSGEFSKNVADGSFRDIFPGDYITKQVTIPDIVDPDNDGWGYIEGKTYTVKFIIADLDIAMYQGSPRVTGHHAVIVPEDPVFPAIMNLTNTNAGGYAGSYMHRTVMPAFAKGLIGAFGEKHLLKSSFDGLASDQLHCTCRLLTLSMRFGQRELPQNGYSRSWYDFAKDSCMGGAQFAIFRLHSDPGIHQYWMSDLTSSLWSSKGFAYIYHGNGGGVDFSWARNACGVRPFALLV